MPEPSPMMEQYRRAKAAHRDAILFFRLGDFYEMFFEDAVEASALLNLTLTKRQGEPMCGVPWHSSRGYIARLLKAGKKVAICEQVSEPGKGKGIVRREVVEVVTPGTALEEDFLEGKANNYLLALCAARGRVGLACLDLGTAEFRTLTLEASPAELLEERLGAELYRLSPRELLVQQSLLEEAAVGRVLEGRQDLILNRLPDWSFEPAQAAEELRSRYGLATLKGLGYDDSGTPELAAAWVLLRYADDTAGGRSGRAGHIPPPKPWDEGEQALVDEASRRNLELVRNLGDSTSAFSLLEALDFTRTAPGSRLLRQWILAPLGRLAAIEERLRAVDFLYRDQRLLASLREALGRVLDAERLASRVAMDKAHAKDLLALRDSIAACEAARGLLGKAGVPGLLDPRARDAEAEAARAARELVEAAIREEPSILLTEGDLLREGYDAECDRLRALRDDSRAVLEAYLEEERERSGIPNLRLRFNRIIGYYLEVSKGKLESVPPHFRRRQSLVTGERFGTARLSELEAEINGATERLVELERLRFLEIRERVKAAVPSILALGKEAAVFDCLASYAWAATSRGYTRPIVDESGRLRIVEGRHPVVEAHLPAGSFVPNGLELEANEAPEGAGGPRGPSFALITGPNMAGKSTYLRQCALIVLMAQAGSFVPALEAEIGLVDRIFCRVGARDDLARGESTFLVEMHETARILNTAGPRSLVIMDEVGRGTSTIDGLAIARAIAERLIEGLGCRTLFATHYHELTALEHPRLRNLSLAVLEEKGTVVFLKRVREGAAPGSYGIHVARLAWLPEAVLERAEALREELARRERGFAGGFLGAAVPPAAAAAGARPAAAAGPAAGGRGRPAQAPLFDPAELVAAEIASLDLDATSPLQALNKLAEFRRTLEAGR